MYIKNNIQRKRKITSITSQANSKRNSFFENMRDHLLNQKDEIDSKIICKKVEITHTVILIYKITKINMASGFGQ